MGKMRRRGLVVLAWLAFTWYGLEQGYLTGIPLGLSYSVGDTESYPVITMGHSYLYLFLWGGGIGLLLTLTLFWRMRGKGIWRVVLPPLLAGITAFSFGFGFSQIFGTTVDLDSIIYRDTLYRLSVWRAEAPGRWQIWQCEPSGWTCTVVHTVPVSEALAGLENDPYAFASKYPAHMEIDASDGQLLLVVEHEDGLGRTTVLPSKTLYSPRQKALSSLTGLFAGDES